MGFRWRLFLCLTVAVIAGAVFDAVADYAGLRYRLPQQLERTLDRAELVATVAVSLESGVPALPGVARTTPQDTRFRVLRGDSVILAVSGLRGTPDLVLRERPLPSGYTLELAVDRAALRATVLASLRQDLTDDLPEIILSVLLAWLLAGFLLHPLRAITRALGVLSLQPAAAVRPVPVPPGNDEIAQLTVVFNRMSTNLHAAFDRERIFTRYASHELRTPLSAIKLQLESLELGLLPAERVVPTVQHHAERMQRVLEALLSLARSCEYNHEPVPLLHLVCESVELLPHELRSRVHVTSVLPTNLKVADPYLVGQCILNLVDNAIKHTHGPVVVVLESRAGAVRIRVQDEGGGVPEELLEQLTHTFFRLSNTVEGSGLGLAFVKHIVRTFGGSLALKNTRSGLEVTLTLPVAA